MTNKTNLSKQLAGALTNGAERATVRAQLAFELGYDINNLKQHEIARLDTVCALRAEIDFLQARRGGELDVARLIAASTALTELLSPGNKGTVVEFVTLPGEWEGDGPIPEDVTIAGLRAQLAYRNAEIEQLKDEIERLRAELTQAQPETTQQQADRPSPPYRTPTAGSQRVVAPATPAPSADPAVVKMDRINAIRPPAHYLKSAQSSEPWEPYVGRFGGII